MYDSNVYKVPNAEIAERGSSKGYGGIGRLPYFIFVTSVVVCLIILVLLFGESIAESPPITWVFTGLVIVASFWVAVLRLRNIGRSGWWVLGTLVPLINLYVGLILFAYPEGHVDHGKLDTPAKIIIAVYIGLTILGFVAPNSVD